LTIGKHRISPLYAYKVGTNSSNNELGFVGEKLNHDDQNNKEWEIPLKL